MSDFPSESADPKRIANEAAGWVLRKDRGLSATEQDDFSEWIAADPRHGQEFARHREQWNKIEALSQLRPAKGSVPNPDLLAAAPRSSWVRRYLPLTLATAALLVVSLAFWARSIKETRQVVTVAVDSPPGGRRVLEDGSIVELNRDSEIRVAFTPSERRIQLLRGEAHLVVAKNPLRPFIVNAAGIDVRAVGTVFNVRVDPQAVEVLVTEGHVRVNADHANGSRAAPASKPEKSDDALLAPCQRVLIPLTPDGGAKQIATLTVSEIDRVLAWQHTDLDFTAAPLREIIPEFNRRNVLQLRLGDMAAGEIKITAKYRSDNLADFVHFLEVGFGIHVEHSSPTEWVLRKTP